MVLMLVEAAKATIIGMKRASQIVPSPTAIPFDHHCHLPSRPSLTSQLMASQCCPLLLTACPQTLPILSPYLMLEGLGRRCVFLQSFQCIVPNARLTSLLSWRQYSGCFKIYKILPSVDQQVISPSLNRRGGGCAMEECHQQQQGRAGAIYTGAPANRSSLTPTRAALRCTCEL